MGARLQCLPVGGRDVPVDDRAVGLRHLAVGDARCLHGVVDIDAAHQKQYPQDHSDKRLHGTPPVTADNAGRGGWFRPSPSQTTGQAKSMTFLSSKASTAPLRAAKPALSSPN